MNTFYWSALNSLVLPAAAVAGSAITLILLLYRLSVARKAPERWTTQDDEVDEFLDWKSFQPKPEPKPKPRRSVAIKPRKESLYDTETEPMAAQPAPTKFKVVPIPATGRIAAVPRKEPLFDREYTGPGFGWQINFFLNPNCFLWPPSDGRPSWKGPADTNLFGSGGCMPAGNQYFVYGVSLTADSDTLDQDYMTLYDHGLVTWSHPGGSPIASWPARMVMPGPQDRFKAKPGPIQDVTIKGQPYVLDQLECFKVTLTCQRELSRQAAVMFSFWGISLRGVCG